jgi:dinuclear metal center YbgI/SA1388 family protein
VVKLCDLVSYLGEFLEVERQPDFCPNGMQVEGVSEVHRIVTGVTACQALFDVALEREAQVVLVHHGLFWNGWEPRIQGMMRSRLFFLLRHGISLLAYHLPLDRHPKVGNNACLARSLGVTPDGGFAAFKGLPVGLVGNLAQPLSRQAFGDRVAAIYGDQCLRFEYGPEIISRVALLSGKGDHDIDGAMAAGADAYLTGEAGVSTLEHAREGKISFYAAGHHSTERGGVQILGEHLVSQFALDVNFVEVENPV